MTEELRGRKVAILARTDLLSIHDGGIESRQTGKRIGVICLKAAV